MKKIKIILTYFLALTCVYITLFKPINDIYVNQFIEQKDKVVIFVLKNDYLVPISLNHDLNESNEENIMLVFNLMKKGINQFGFTSIIPKSVLLLDVDVNDEIVKLNFNEAVYMMNTNYELRFIEAVVNSVLQFDHEYKVKFYVNGELIDEMPLSQRKMINFDKKIGINNFNLETYNPYESDSKMVVEYVNDLNFDYYVINSIRVDKNMELLQFVNRILYKNSSSLICENVEWEDDIMVLHMNEAFLLDENTINEKSIMNLLYSLKLNDYSDKFIIKVNGEMKKIQNYEEELISIKHLYFNIFEQ